MVIIELQSIIGIIKVASVYACVLFDPKATHSFILSMFARKDVIILDGAKICQAPWMLELVA